MLSDRDFIPYIRDLDNLHDEHPEIVMNLIDEMQEDFRIFMHFVWKNSFGFTPHRIQYCFANLMQQSETHTILMAFREFGKTIMDATLTAWDKFRDPHHTTLVVSAAKPRAMEITGMSLAIIKGCSFLEDLIPGSDDLDGRMAFTVGNREYIVKEASCISTSITTGNTGAHADRILSDDLEIPKNSNTQEKRQDIMDGVDEYTYILNEGGTEIYIGTPQTEESIYFKLAALSSYTLYRVPCEYPDPEDETAMRNLAPFLLDDLRDGTGQPGEPTYPERFPMEALAKIKAKSPSSYALQMLLDPSASDESRYPLKLKDFIVTDLPVQYGPSKIAWGTANPIDEIESVGLGKDKFYSPSFIDWTPVDYQHTVMGLDPAGSGEDEVGYAVGKSLLGKVFVTAAGGIDGGADERTMKKLCKIMIEQDVKEIRVQKTAIDSMYSINLQRVMGEMGLQIPITQTPAVGQKEERIIDTIEPVLAAHRLIIDTKVARDQILMQQLTRLTRERGALLHDDRVEAIQIMLTAFEDSFRVNVDQIIEDNEEQEFQDEIASMLGSPHRSKSKSFLSIRSRSSRRGKRRPNMW